MRAALEIVLPVFALILCGWAFVRARILSAEGIKGISNFVFYLAIPALLFRSTAGGLLTSGVDFGVVYAYYAGALIVYGLAMAIGRAAFKLNLIEQALMAISATFSNSVLIGIPLVFMAFGPAGQASVLLITSLHAVILLSLTTVLIEVGRGAGRASGRVIASTMLALVRNPLIVAIAFGTAWGAMDFSLPASVDMFTRLLAGAAAPAALFALGGTLAGLHVAGDLREISVIATLRLLAHPALVWLLATYVFDLGHTETSVAVLVAALPTGVNPFLMAQRYGAYIRRAASSTLITTMLSVLTTSLLMAWYTSP